MKFGNIKNFSLKKKDNEDPPDEVLIESTTADQIAEMKQRMAGRTKNLEAQTKVSSLNKKNTGTTNGGSSVGPHPPLQELSLDDIQLEDIDDDDLQFDTPTEGSSPVQVVNLSRQDSEPEIEHLNLEEVPTDPAPKASARKKAGPEIEDDDLDEGSVKPDAVKASAAEAAAEAAAKTAAKTAGGASLGAAAGGGNDLQSLFSQEEEEEHPLANLINFLPDVSVQELEDDIAEIKSIIQEWQHSR